MAGKGVVYLLCGMGIAERMVVSLWSLRKHYSGPITILASNPEEMEFVGNRLKEFGVDRQQITRDTSVDRGQAFLTKVHIPTWTPYRETVYLDADTVVCGSIEPLFGYPLVLTQYADWVTTGRKISGRIKMWSGLSPWIDNLIDRQLSHSRPAINTGVFGFNKSNPDLTLWPTIMAHSPDAYLGDEIAMQLLIGVAEHVTLDDKYNCACSHGVHRDEAVIWHFHGNRHMRDVPGREIWINAFNECRSENAAGLADWAGTYDRRLDKWLKAAA